VEEVRDYAQQAEAPRQEDEFIFLAQLVEDVLLEFLSCHQQQYIGVRW
jgi:hypothetical protein